EFLPTLKISPFTASAGASSVQRIAAQISSMCTTGRHGLPSLVIAIRWVVQASAHRSLITMSKRIRGEGPKAVALRRNVTQKSWPAIGRTSRSTNVLHLAYAVCGLTGLASFRKSPLPRPYTLHEEA